MQQPFTCRKYSEEPHNHVTTWCVIPESTICSTIAPLGEYGVNFTIAHGKNQFKRKVSFYKKRILTDFYLHEHKFVEINGMLCVKIVTDVEKPMREVPYKILFDKTKVEKETMIKNKFVDENGNVTSRYVDSSKRKREDDEETQTKSSKTFMGDDVELVVDNVENERDELIKKHPHNPNEPNKSTSLRTVNFECFPTESIITQIGKPTIFADDDGSYTIYYKFNNPSKILLQSNNFVGSKIQFCFSIHPYKHDGNTMFIEVDLPKFIVIVGS